MKKGFIFLFSLFMSASVLVSAQEQDKTTGQKVKEGAQKTGKAIKKGAKKTANKTAELAVKGTAKVVDRTYDGKTAANGRTVYITEDSRYYWVDSKGRRQYVTKDQLIDKH